MEQPILDSHAGLGPTSSLWPCGPICRLTDFQLASDINSSPLYALFLYTTAYYYCNYYTPTNYQEYCFIIRERLILLNIEAIFYDLIDYSLINCFEFSFSGMNLSDNWSSPQIGKDYICHLIRVVGISNALIRYYKNVYQTLLLHYLLLVLHVSLFHFLNIYYCLNFFFTQSTFHSHFP